MSLLGYGSTMESVTVEFQRYGDPSGMLRLTESYLRTVGAFGALEEVAAPVTQENLGRALGALSYRKYEDGDPRAVLRRAEEALRQLADALTPFLAVERPEAATGGSPYQADIVVQPLEIAQLPFEILEDLDDDIVITRRIRHRRTRPAVVESSVPKILFAWAQPGSHQVPHDRHREKLLAVLDDWGGSEVLTELPNATRRQLNEHLSGDHGYTHVHLLVHGCDPPERDPASPFELHAEPEPPAYIALDDGSGGLGIEGGSDRCAPGDLAAMFDTAASRPPTFAVAACRSGAISPMRAGATFAHALHSVGVPVVVASQLALTKPGSDELITTFLAEVVTGEDPRRALRSCRDALRAAVRTTFYDRMAVVGYVHLDDDFDLRLNTRRLEIALARLNAMSRRAANETDHDELVARFASVRRDLERLASERALDAKQLEELYGLQASSLKREAQAAWDLAAEASELRAVEPLVTRSREALAEALDAYERAARVSRDHHWVWVQWLALEVVVNGAVDGHRADWVVAHSAASDAAGGAEAGIDGLWARGSLLELYLLAPVLGVEVFLDGAPADLAARVADELLALGPSFGREGASVIASTLGQLDRYVTWWGCDPGLAVPEEVLGAARHLGERLRLSDPVSSARKA